MTDFYNADIKQKFLSLYPSKSQITYRNVLEKSKTLEDELGKDMSDFELEDFVLFFKQIGIDYPTTARSYGRICTKYVDWALQQGYSHTKNNPLKLVKTKWFEQFVNEETKLFFTASDLRGYEEACVNAQDAVIIRLLFEGVQGKAVSEIRNLKKSDINPETGLTTLTDEDGSNRELNLTERCLELIQKAIDQKEYIKSNGSLELPNNITESTLLLESDFVIRSSNTSKDKHNGAVDKFVIYRRIASIEKQLNLKHFNIKNIVKSGILKFVRDRLIVGQTINYTMLVLIADDFRVKASSLRDFVTKETINKLYGDSF